MCINENKEEEEIWFCESRFNPFYIAIQLNQINPAQHRS